MRTATNYISRNQAATAYWFWVFSTIG